MLVWSLPRISCTEKNVGIWVEVILFGNHAMSGSNNQTILLVEDYTDSREMLRLLLQDFNYRILEAQNGKEALDLAVKEKPDLVLTDFNLPDIDGTALIRRLRKLSERMRRIPMIMLTAHDRHPLYELAMAAGCTAFLTKPVNFSVLQKTIQTLLEESRERSGPVNDICR
jgi:two-component system, cell cycle response regulator DivK